MYFDLAPKSKRSDLYDFDDQFDELMGILQEKREAAPIIVIKGKRRTGKTSLIKTTLNESNLPYLFIDGGAFADMPVIKKRDLLKEIERGLNITMEKEKGLRKTIAAVLKGVTWVKLDSKPPFIHFEWRKPTKTLNPLDLIYSLDRAAKENKTKFILVLDEAQEFRRLAGYRLQNLIAHTYDHIEGVQIIVSGSQIGLLNDFLGTDDPDSPLYGRGTADISAPRISSDLAADFLQKGASQVGVKLDREVVAPVIERLDGIIGWLTFFGNKVRRGTSVKDALNRAIEGGSKLGAKEFYNFLKVRRDQGRRRYVSLLKTVVQLENAKWSELKERLEIQEKKTIANNVFSDLLKNLVDADFLDRKDPGLYSISDPIFLHAVRTDIAR